ncbi:MAG: hypothetical protein GY829_11915, partial [Gammaproteobacteria bacterium]|nr:hypothetical protein [Gammaproteobacteria bacterium]
MFYNNQNDVSILSGIRPVNAIKKYRQLYRQLRSDFKKQYLGQGTSKRCTSRYCSPWLGLVLIMMSAQAVSAAPDWSTEEQAVYLAFKTSSATFSAGTAIDSAKTKTMSITLGDMDGDGDLDVSAGNTGYNILYFNNGNGEFSQGPNVGHKYTNAIALGDIDGDGDLDVIVGNKKRENLFFLN